MTSNCCLIFGACGYVEKLRAVNNLVCTCHGRHVCTSVINGLQSNVRAAISTYPYALLDPSTSLLPALRFRPVTANDPLAYWQGASISSSKLTARTFLKSVH